MADAVATLTGRDESGLWVEAFAHRGHTYTLRVGGPGCATFDALGASLPVWDDKGRPRLLRVRPDDSVAVLSRTV